MIRASIDIGSNSVLLLAAEFNSENKLIKEILNLSHVTSLGKDLDKNKVFIQSSMNDTYSALFEYREELKKIGVDTKQVVVTATEASRVALNAKEFFLKIKKELGFSIVTLTGEGEAYYTAKGVVSNFESEGDDLYVMDIGGASTELIHIKKNPFTIINSISLPVGSVRASDWFNSNQFEIKMDEILANSFEKFKTKNLISVAGTMTSLASIYLKLHVYDDQRLEGVRITRDEFKKFIDSDILDEEKIKQSFPYLSKRAPFLRAGAGVAYLIACKLGVDEFHISTRGLRYGVILQGEIDGTFTIG